MARFRFAPLALAVLALAACGKSDDGAAPKAAGPVAAVPPPAGTTWAETVEATELGVRMGNPKAAITVIEYGSYTCPHCRDFQAEAHEAIERDYVNSGKINFEYRPMIRDVVDLTAALVARCAGPEAFFALNTQLFANQNAMIEKIQAAGDAAFKAAVSAAPEQRQVKVAELAGLIEFAKQRGVPETKVRSCLADSKLAQKLADESNDVVKKYPEFPGTPSFILNGTLLDNTASWEKLKPQLRDAGA